MSGAEVRADDEAETSRPASSTSKDKEDDNNGTSSVLGGGQVRANECECCGSVFCYYCVHALTIPVIAFFRDCCVHRVCSPYCFKPPRPTWNRSFVTASDALKVISKKLYIKEEDVRVVRLIDYTPIPKWLAPRTHLHVKSTVVSLRKPGRNDDATFGVSVPCEYFYPTKCDTKKKKTNIASTTRKEGNGERTAASSEPEKIEEGRIASPHRDEPAVLGPIVEGDAKKDATKETPYIESSEKRARM
eukprot:g521.t1